MEKEDVKREKEEDKEEVEKKKKEEWLKKEKIRMIEQRKEYMSYIKGVMRKKGFNPKLKKDKFLGGVRGRG
ncbi:MAG TPA: hypothetical protein DEG96_03150 [Candidatus Atribacteria bacterium]|nr:hypothetical protein [Candidatus Atribacteria bacterium]